MSEAEENADGRVVHPKAVSAKNALKQFCGRLTLRMRKKGFFHLPTDAEWTEVRRLVGETLAQRSLSVGSPVVWADFVRVESYYPDVKLKLLLKLILKLLKERSAPVDRLRVSYWEALRIAAEDELGGRDNDVGLVQWILEHAQWQEESQWDPLTPDQWDRIESILKPLVSDLPPMPSALEMKNWSYSQFQQNKELRGRVCLRELIRSAGVCRQQVGAEFSRQLQWLWSLDASWVQAELSSFTHVCGGRARPAKPERKGYFIQEGRPPTVEDKKALRRRARTAERVKKHRAKKTAS